MSDDTRQEAVLALQEAKKFRAANQGKYNFRELDKLIEGLAYVLKERAESDNEDRVIENHLYCYTQDVRNEIKALSK